MRQDWLRQLIIASGFAGTTGQSFRNHVTGAGSGVKASDYEIETASFTSPFESPPYIYGDNSFHVITASFAVFNSKASLILNKTTGAWAVTPTEIDGGTGFSAAIQSVTWAYPTASLAVLLRGAYTPGTPSVTTDVYYIDYTYPSIPPDNASYLVKFSITSGSVAASGTGSMYINVSITPDQSGAAFNSAMNNASVLNNFRVSVYRRENPSQPIEVEWHTNSSFTSLHTTNMNFNISSDPNTDTSYWVRYRNLGSSDSWTLPGGTGEVHWMDPRTDI